MNYTVNTKLKVNYVKAVKLKFFIFSMRVCCMENTFRCGFFSGDTLPPNDSGPGASLSGQTGEELRVI